MHEPDDDQLERTLLARVALGEEEALHALYTRLRPRLWHYLWRQLDGDRPLIEDTLQEVFLAVWRAAGNFRGEAKVTTWVFQIAHHLALKARNTPIRRAETSPQDETEGEGIEAVWQQTSFEDAALDRVAFAEALRQLSPKHREALELVFTLGFTLNEAATILSVPAGTVKSRISFARQALLRALQHQSASTEHTANNGRQPQPRTTQQEAHHDA